MTIQCLPLILKSKGNIINLSTVGATHRAPNLSMYVGALCPGPVDTEFNKVAGVSFSLGGISAKSCAIDGVYNMFEERKMIIVPTVMMKALTFLSRFVPTKPLLLITGKLQRRKGKAQDSNII